MEKVATKNYMIAQVDEIPTVACPCGSTQRAFISDDNPVATLHLLTVTNDARTHYHKKLTEIYFFLEVEGEGYMELDGELIPVKPMTSILIKPGCRHRAIGNMKLINMPIPAFDPTDEWFD